MEEDLPISALADYYVDRYKLSFQSTRRTIDQLPPDRAEEIKTFAQALRRIIKNKKIGKVTLWDTIQTKNGVATISIAYFESHCFEEWSAHITRCYKVGDTKQFEIDRERNAAQSEDAYYQQLADEAIRKYNKALESYDAEYDENDWGDVSPDNVQKRGHIMMLEALYNVFFESFNWDLLERDMIDAEFFDTGGKNPPITAECVRANERLKSFKNYTGKLKTPAVRINKR